VTAQLHPSAERVLFAAASLWRERGIPPTVRELAERAGFRGWSTVHYWLHELRSDGFVQWDEHTYRSLRLTPRPLEHLQLKEAR
jgi:SOS-response transcriptional repressor LexA